MRSFATVAVVLALVPAMSACGAMRSLAMLPRASEAAVLPGQVEPVHAVAITGDQAVFWVTSNGCTAKEDITPVVRDSSGGPIITLRRIKEDRCRESRPEGTEVRWSFEELGLAPGTRLSVDNPYQLPPT